MLRDSFDRNFEYLRLSVTDVCNFRCVYCLPNGYQKSASRESFLSVNEIRNLVAGFASMGFWKVRLTGGEPTVRQDIVEIASVVSSVHGIRRVALSTNGYRLKALAQPLREAGVRAVNISVDSLDPERFEKITGRKNISEILDGVGAALKAGFETVKINAVLLKGQNDADVDSLIQMARDLPLSVRFIELMRTGDNRELFEKSHRSGREIVARLLEQGWKPRQRRAGDGPAREFEHVDYRGQVGVIAPYSKDFCNTCNRLRVSARGGLRLCLFGEADHSLRPWLQAPEQLPDLVHRVRTLIDRKTVSHTLHEGIYGRTEHLAGIGG